MGACIGKKNSKYLKPTSPKSNSIQPPQSKTQDDIPGNKSSPSLSKKLPVTDDLIVNNGDDNEWRISQLSGNSIDSEIQFILNEQKMINEVFSQPFQSTMISITDTELEFELSNLIFEQTEDNNVETSLTIPTDKDKNRDAS